MRVAGSHALLGGHFKLYKLTKLENTQACRNPRLTDKTIMFSEHEVSKVVVIVTR
jgi:hypothetical protein